MNKRLHLLNGVVIAIGLTAVRAPTTDPYAIAHLFGYLAVPIVLGTLLPDIDTEYGTHRKHGHNVFVLAGALLYPVVFGNLYALWIGVAAHLTADLTLSGRGCALLYPFSRREWGLRLSLPESWVVRPAMFSALCMTQLAGFYSLAMLGLYP